jgi:hypothetical protein
MMNNWAKDYLKYTNETDGGSSPQGGSGSNGPGCGGIVVGLLLIWLIVSMLAKL